MAGNTQSPKNANVEQGSAGNSEPKTSSPAPVGRPSDFTQDLADRICSELAEGKSMRTVCQPESMPDKSTVFRWLRTNEEFRDQYARAKEEAADAMAEDLLDIADDGSNDFMELEDKDGNTYKKVDQEVLQRSRLRVDTRKFLMAKMKPKKYGEKLDLTSGGEKLNRGMSDAELNAILARAGTVDDQAGASSQAR